MNLTENALAQLKKILSENENPKSGIRFYTVMGCCSPLLKMDVVTSPVEGDVVLKKGEVNFFVTPEADKILSPLTIGFKEGKFYSVTKTK